MPISTFTRPTAISRSIPPPVGGLDTRSALADMPPENAVIMDNVFPEPERVSIRPDHTSHATGMTGSVETLIPYIALSGTGQLFAANNGSIFNVTSAGAVGAAVVSSLTNNRWQQTAIGTSGGQFIHICNGADTPRLYNGTTFSNAAYTGPTLVDVIWTELHQRRIWLGEKDKLSGWFLAFNAITGAASEFSFAGVARKGGFIMAAKSWTRDSGAGADDVMIFLTSEGEAIVYAGTDPTDAAKWALIGVFEIGRPIGRRCMIKAGADVIMLTEDGAVSAASILSVDRSQAERVAITQQINEAFNQEVRDNGTLFGWQPILYPRGQMLIFNVPQSASSAHQYVFNTLTNKPCRFKGIEAACWGILGDTLYLGDFSGVVHKFDTGATSDNGTAIEWDCLPAFNYFGSPGVEKRVTLVEPIFESIGNPNAALDLNTDFQVRAPTGVSTPAPTASATWGVSKWGVGIWGTSGQIFRGWRGVRGKGRALSLRVRISTTTARPSWVATNFQLVPGGTI